MEELGKFELPVLAAVARLRGSAYGVSVMEEVSKREKREVSYGAVHVTLDRLKDKGFVSTKMGEPTPERGGRRKRYYEMTGKGEQALQAAWSRYKTNFAGLALKPAGGVTMIENNINRHVLWPFASRKKWSVAHPDVRAENVDLVVMKADGKQVFFVEIKETVSVGETAMPSNQFATGLNDLAGFSGAARLIDLILTPDAAESVIGDLEEQYSRRVKADAAYAKWWLFAQVGWIVYNRAMQLLAQFSKARVGS